MYGMPGPALPWWGPQPQMPPMPQPTGPPWQPQARGPLSASVTRVDGLVARGLVDSTKLCLDPPECIHFVPPCTGSKKRSARSKPAFSWTESKKITAAARSQLFPGRKATKSWPPLNAAVISWTAQLKQKKTNGSKVWNASEAPHHDGCGSEAATTREGETPPFSFSLGLRTIVEAEPRCIKPRANPSPCP